VANSLFSSQLFNEAYGRNADCYIYPGVDLKRFRPAGKKQKYLFMVSRLTKFKNVSVAIEAMSRIKHKDYKLIIGGDGEEKDNLVALAKKLNLSERVQFVGTVPSEDLARWYAEAKLVIFTSQNEPFGMVPLEALASGTPVIGMNSGGLRETLIHNQNGILLDHATPETLAHAIDDVLADGTKYDSLKKAARASSLEFNWERHVAEWEAILEDRLYLRSVPFQGPNRVSQRVLGTTRACDS
jgi:glycosyltransferase involved in cell wall biosynthesis